jgi:hypothetical protein
MKTPDTDIDIDMALQTSFAQEAKLFVHPAV